MSTFLRALLFLVTWVVFAFLTFQFCIEPECCGREDGTVIVDPEPPAEEDDYALVSKLGEREVLSGDLWPDLRNRLLSEYRANPDQLLDVYGHYYADEPKPADYENMGFSRADQIKALLVPDIPADKINILARRIDTATPLADEPFTAGTFNWRAMPADGGGDGDGGAPKVEIVQLDKDEIIIRFPFNSDQKDIDPEVDAYLGKLAQRLNQTNETVVITGHTDNIDTDAFNMRLGQRRADFIRRILVRNGAPEARITTRSEGESNPVDTNSTPSGRQNNRRAVVKLTPQ